MAKKNEMANYRVGYGRPPKGTQFKPGRSGNPKGRPMPAPTLPALLNKVLKTNVELRDGEIIRRVSKREALMILLVTRALKGHHPSVREILEMENSPEWLPAREEAE